jgi:hypothetical protein
MFVDHVRECQKNLLRILIFEDNSLIQLDVDADWYYVGRAGDLRHLFGNLVKIKILYHLQATGGFEYLVTLAAIGVYSYANILRKIVELQ